MRNPAALRFVLFLAVGAMLGCAPTVTPGSEGRGPDGTATGGDGGAGNDGSATMDPDGSSAPDGSMNDPFMPGSALTATIDESCDLGVFAGFVITVFDNDCDCDNRWSAGGEHVQFSIGETTGLPVAGGRSYDVIPYSSDRPGDGEAHAVLSGRGTADYGTITISGQGGNYFGTYDFGMGPVSFAGGVCPLGPGDCD